MEKDWRGLLGVIVLGMGVGWEWALGGGMKVELAQEIAGNETCTPCFYDLYVSGVCEMVLVGGWWRSKGHWVSNKEQTYEPNGNCVEYENSKQQ